MVCGNAGIQFKRTEHTGLSRPDRGDRTQIIATIIETRRTEPRRLGVYLYAVEVWRFIAGA